MFNKLLSVVVSFCLIGSLAFASVISQNHKEYSIAEDISLADYVAAAPELVELAKEFGFNAEPENPAEKRFKNHGHRFQQPGQKGVTYQQTDSEIPVLVLLAEFPDTAKGAPAERIPASYFHDIIFGHTYNPYELDLFAQYAEHNGIQAPIDRTMQNAYKESSYGKVTLTTYDNVADIGWITLPRGADYYLDQTGEYAENGQYLYGNNFGNARIGELVRDMLKIADEEIDFSRYAEDGEVPNIFIIHEGTGAEWSSDPAQIWSHKWNIQSALYVGKWYETGLTASEYEGIDYQTWLARTTEDALTYDGVIVNNYTVSPEINGNVSGWNNMTKSYSEEHVTGPYPATVGVMAHEFGHALGLPDFYDTDGSSAGTGYFSLMSNGSWGNYPHISAYGGNSPVHFDPFSKMFLGWVDPIEVTPEDGIQEMTLRPVNEAPDIVKMVVQGSNGTEYFLFENRQQEGFNQGMGRMGEDAHGLVAWHIDESVIDLYHTAHFRPNNVENWMNKRFQYNQSVTANDGTVVKHYGLSVLQADGLYDLEKGRNYGDATDFFKTGSQITPNSGNVHTGSYYFWRENNPVPAHTGIHVTNITENEDGSITATFFYRFRGNKN